MNAILQKLSTELIDNGQVTIKLGTPESAIFIKAAANYDPDLAPLSIFEKSKYSQKQLEDAFGLVQPKEHWKDPINAIIDAEVDRDLITEAVIHFTATVPEFLSVKGKKSSIRVIADGYRMGPAGP